MALAFPAGPTGGQQYTGPNGIVYQWDSAVGVWIKVNSVQTMTSGSTAATGAARIPTGDTAARPAATLAAGQFRYNSQIPQLEYSDGTSWLAAGSVSAATLAEAAAGTLNTVFSSPQTAVPKDASGMTGAALVPGGTTLQRPGTTVTGMLRYNSTTLPATMEFWDSAAWSSVGGAGTAGLGISITGSIIKVSIPTVSTPPVAGALAAQAVDGSLYWDNTLGALFIRYNDGTTTQWVQAAASASGGGTAVSAASLAEAAAGTSNTKYNSPQTSVPKDASGMTGAALIPTGTTLQQPATPVGGMLRMNTTYNPDSLEVYDGTAATWKPLAYAAATPTSLTNLTISANGPLVGGAYNNVTVNAGVTATISGVVEITAYGNVTINGSINGAGVGASSPTTGGAQAGASEVDSYGTGGFGPGGGIFDGPSNASISTGGSTYGASSLLGSSGAAGLGQYFNNANGLSRGGRSGASLVIRCYGTLTVGGSSVIDCSGGNGSCNLAAGSGNIAGGGGGSGGLIYLQGESLSISGTLSVAGGAGSNGINAAFGGGGGGGGYIIYASPSTIVDASSRNLAGGAAGAGGGTSGYGGAGAGFGGQGGSNGAAGSSGQVLTNFFL